MAYRCFNCYKGSVMGTSHRHRPGVAGRQHLRKAPKTPKLFVPNLHTAYLIETGYSKKVKLCSRCRRMLKRQGKIKVWKKEPTKPIVVKKPMVIKEATLPIKGVKKTVMKKILLAKKTQKRQKLVAEKSLKKTRKAIIAKTPTVSVEELVGKK